MPKNPLSCLFGLLIIFSSHLAMSQADLHYRVLNNVTGNWNGTTTWESRPDNSNQWTSTAIPPNSTSLTITIGNGETAIIPSGYSVEVDQVTIGAGGILTISNGGSFPVVNGAGTDLTNQGTLNNGGTLTLALGAVLSNTSTFNMTTGTFTVTGTFQSSSTTTGFTVANTTFLSGSRYRHLWTIEGVVPLATWNPGSVMEVAGYTGNITATATGNWSQPFYNVELNLTLLSPANRVVLFSGLLNNIVNNLTVLSTGGATGGRVRLTATNNSTMTVGGNLSLSAATRLDITNGATGVILNVNGNVSNSGTLTMAFTATGISTLNVRGNLSNLAGGIITTVSTLTTAIAGIGTIIFNGTLVQTFSNAGIISNHVRFSIPSGSTVDFGTSAMSGTGTFTLSGELRVGSMSTNGAIQLATGTGSNLQNTGTRTYNSGSTIRYNGAALQYIGNGYPPPAATGVNLIIDNTNGVSVAAAVAGFEVTGNLTLNSGVLNISGKALTLDANIIQISTTSTITVNSTTDITINGSGALGTFPFAAGAQTFRSFTLNRVSSGSVVFANDLTLVGVVTLTNGKMIFNGQPLTLNGTFSATSGLLSSNATSTLTIGGTGSLGTLIFDPSGNQLLSLSMNRLASGTAALSGTLIINSNLYLLNGDFTNGGGLTLANGVMLTRVSTAQLLSARPIALGTYNVDYQGSAMTTGFELPDPLNTTYLNNLTIDGGTVSLNQNITINGYFTANILDLNGGAFIITMKGTNWNLNGGVFTPSSSTVVFDGSTTVGGGGSSVPAFNNVQLTSTSTLTFPASDVNVSGDINFAAGSTFIPTAGNVVMNGSVDQAISSNGNEFYGIQLTNGAGALNINSTLPIQHLLSIQSATAVVNTNNNLIILSRGITTDLDGAIGPITTGATINGNVTAQRYMDAIGNTFRYLGAAVSSALPPVSWGGTIYTYQYTGATGAYAVHSTASPLIPGTGYVINRNMSSPDTWSVNGPVTTGSFTWTFTQEGWHLVGNPFASAIRWFNNPGIAWDLTNIATTIAVTDNAVSGYPNYFRYWSFNPIDDPTNWGTGPLQNGMVSMGQAFWVYAGAGGGSLTIYEQAKENGLTGEFYRTKSAEDPDLLKIILDNGNFADVAYLKLNPGATHGYEFRYDLKKLWNPEMNVYLTDRANSALVINAMEKIEEEQKISLGIEVMEPGNFTLSFDNLEQFSYGQALFLVDQQERKVVPVSAGRYTFEIKDSSKPLTNRFYLTLTPTLSERKLAEIIETFPNPVQEMLTIRIPSTQIVAFTMMDNQGHVIRSEQITGTHQVDMRGYAQGMYVLRFSQGGEVVIRKIIRQ